MGAVRDLDQPLALTSESSKDKCVVSFGLGTVESSIDSVLPKALHGVAFQVRCCSAVLGVLEAPNAMDTL